MRAMFARPFRCRRRMNDVGGRRRLFPNQEMFQREDGLRQSPDPPCNTALPARTITCRSYPPSPLQPPTNRFLFSTFPQCAPRPRRQNCNPPFCSAFAFLQKPAALSPYPGSFYESDLCLILDDLVRMNRHRTWTCSNPLAPDRPPQTTPARNNRRFAATVTGRLERRQRP